MPNMTIDLASGHMLSGCRRRPAVVAIQAMSPWRPSSRKSASRSPIAGLTAEGVVTRAASNPAARASASTSCFRSAVTFAPPQDGNSQ
jgi:hypothetical protein